MVKKQKGASWTQKIANFFGGLGYASLLLQWLWFGLTALFPLVANWDVKNSFLMHSSESTTAAPSASMAMPGWLGIVLTIFALVFTIGLTIFAIIAIPKTIGKTGRTVTQGTANLVIPKLEHHHKMTVPQKRKLRFEITWSVKLVLWLIPLAALLFPFQNPEGLTEDHVVVLSFFTASFTLFWFLIQFVIVKLAHISPDKTL